MDTPLPSPGAEPARPLRPLLWLACALGAGTWLGLLAREGVAARASVTAAGLALAALVAAREGLAPSWSPWVLLLAFARGSALAVPGSLPRALTAREANGLRQAPLVGTWRVEQEGRSGWVAPFPGRGAAGRGAPILLEPEALAPAEGTPVAILPGSEVVPWPRGPAQAPGRRSRSFGACSPVAVDELVRLGPAPRTLTALAARPLRCLADLRAAAGARVRTVERAASAGLLQALAIGARDGVPAERLDLFARTGTSHLLALSGWHVSLFAALVILPLARRAPRGRGRLWALGLVALLLVAFAALAGAEKPVLRATLAVLLLQLAALRSGPRPRRPDGLSFLSAAFALECLLDPAGIRSLSLTLTYAATLGLILGTGALARGLSPAPASWDELARGPLARAARRVRSGLASGLAASAAAVLATSPLVWTTFGELAPAGIVLTLLVLPPFAFLSLLAWLAALLPWSALAWPAEAGARVLYGVLALGDRLPGTPLVLPPRPFVVLALGVTLAFLGLRSARARRAAALVLGLVLLPWSAAPSGLELCALDVGHGSALVLRAPGLEALVFDAGSRDRRGVAGAALLPLLARWDVAEASVVLSHPDHDHASGLERLCERVPVRAWLGAALPGPRAPPPGERLDLAHGHSRWETRCPDLALALLRGSGREGNEGSRGLLVQWRDERLLLLGDAEQVGLADLSLEPGPLRLLLAPHHGSDSAALGPLLTRYPPREVWISAARPPPIAAELGRRGLPWRWTGRDGPLSLRLP